jgi:hypothetical protein
VNFAELAQQYAQMSDRRIVMSFKGTFAQPIIVEIGNTIRNKIAPQQTESVPARTLLMKKIFAVFIELSQNILFYSAEKEIDEYGKECGVGILVVSEQNTSYCVSSGNQILRADEERIVRRLNAVSNLSKDDMKTMYNEQRKLPRTAEGRGAGLGMLDIARRADLPIECASIPLSDQHSLLMISAYFIKP